MTCVYINKAIYTNIFMHGSAYICKKTDLFPNLYNNPTTYLPIHALNITYMSKKILQLKFCVPATSHVAVSSSFP